MSVSLHGDDVEVARDPFAVDRAAELRRRAVSSGQHRQDTACCAAAVVSQLASGLPRRGMSPQLVTLRESRRPASRLLAHPGQEFVYVLNGAVELRVVHSGEQNVVTLSAGDSCLISSTFKHRFSATSISPYHKPHAEIILVQWRPREKD